MTPDVSVIVPVYNTLPYLRDCLDSLVGQTIGQGRLQVVAVDDGSTDGSSAVLDDYATEHPDLFVLVHQENSGGPARPCNVGLEHATGRYVFFLGADDHLGLEACERMVAKADEWESDVVCVRLVGTNGREIGQSLFAENQREIEFPDQRPFLTANTKLFRRSVLEDHGIRYQEDIFVASDQTFTIEAMYRSKRISVLGDYEYYYAVLRSEGGNIMFQDDWGARLDAIDSTMRYVARLISDPDLVDAVLVRHLKWEFASRLRDIDEYAEDEHTALVARAKSAADLYLTDGLSRMLPVLSRLRLRHAQASDLDAIRQLNEAAEEGDPVSVVLRDHRVYLAYPGFGRLPDEWFEVTHDLSRVRSYVRAEVTDLAWRESDLVVQVRTRLAPGDTGALRVALHPTPSGSHDVALDGAIEDLVATDAGTDLVVVVRGADLATHPGKRWSVWLDLGLPDPETAVPLRTTFRVETAVDLDGRHVKLIARPGKTNSRLVVTGRAVAGPGKPHPGTTDRWKRLFPWTSA